MVQRFLNIMAKIFNYFDYREFLRNDLEERKRKSPGFSLRSLAMKLGLSPSTLIRIFNGKRNLSHKLIPGFIKYLGLRSREAEYFTRLVSFCQAKTEKLRIGEYDELVNLRSGKTRITSGAKYTVYNEWYYTAVRELLRFYPFRGNFLELSRMTYPPITVHEAKRAVDILVQLGFIDRDGDTYIVRDENISTGELWHGTAIERFHRNTLAKAIEGLDTIDRKDRDYSTMTMCCSPEGYKKVRILLRETRRELTRIEESDLKRNRVYQVNIQLFPMSKEYESKKT